MQTPKPHHTMRARLADEQGVALVIALLAMLLLTALGMALTMTTNTENKISANYRDGVETRDYDYVILATGSDTVGFLRRLMSPGEPERLGLGEERDLERRIGFDLAVEGLTPRLHFPMLSGLRQGPGFANLSCLGRLSDRILSGYVEAS